MNRTERRMAQESSPSSSRSPGLSPGEGRLARLRERWLRPRPLWAAFFVVWLAFLSGAMAPLGGGPGVLQAVRLRALHESKASQALELEHEIERLTAESERLEKSRVAQEREIRRVLGYAAPDEIIFDFTAAERVADSGH